MNVGQLQDSHYYVKLNWRIWLSLGTLAAIVGVAWAGWNATGIPAAAASLEEDLAALKHLGMATTPEEVRRVASEVPGQNAGPIYQSLYKRLLVNPRARKVAELYHLSRYGLTAAEQKEARRALAAFEPELDLARKASRMPALNFDRPWEQGAAVLMPEYSQMRLLCYGYYLRAIERSRSGNKAGALDDVETIIRIGAQCQQEPTFIASMIGTGIEDLGFTAMEQAIQFDPSDHQFLRQMLALVEQAKPIDVKRAMTSEVLFGMTLYKQMATRPNEFFRDYGMREQDVNPGLRLVRFSSVRRAYEGRFVHYHLQLFDSLPEDPYDYEAAAQAFDRISEAIQKDESPVTQGAFSFLHLGFPFWGFADSLREHEARKRVVETGLRVLLSGKPFPVELDTPLDPFASGKALRYRSDGKTFQVYSIGKNREDDKGARKAQYDQGDLVFGYPALPVKDPRPIPSNRTVPAGAPPPAKP